jgi:hypothetical protein
MLLLLLQTTVLLLIQVKLLLLPQPRLLPIVSLLLLFYKMVLSSILVSLLLLFFGLQERWLMLRWSVKKDMLKVLFIVFKSLSTTSCNCLYLFLLYIIPTLISSSHIGKKELDFYLFFSVIYIFTLHYQTFHTNNNLTFLKNYCHYYFIRNNNRNAPRLFFF